MDKYFLELGDEDVESHNRPVPEEVRNIKDYKQSLFYVLGILWVRFGGVCLFIVLSDEDNSTGAYWSLNLKTTCVLR